MWVYYFYVLAGTSVLLIWTSQGIRLWNAWRYQHKWTAFEIVSHLLSILSAAVISTPLILTLYGDFVLGPKIIMVRETMLNECGNSFNTSSCISCGPTEASFGVQTFHCDAINSMEQDALMFLSTLTIGSRMATRTGLWLAKCSFVAFFLGFRQVLSRRTRLFLYVTTGVVPAAMLAILLLDAFNHLIIMSRAAIPLSFSFSNELVASWLSIIADIFLIVIPYSTVKALNLPRRTTALLVAIVSITLLLALLRLWLMEAWLAHFAMEAAVENNGNEALIIQGSLAFDIVNALETYVAVLVANLPGIRALLRSIKGPKKEWMGEGSLEDGKASIQT